ncbi:MAG: adenylate cyclase, partial [Nostoc sp.]
ESVYGEGTTVSLWLVTGNAHLPTQQVLKTSTELNMSRARVELADLELVKSGIDNIEDITRNFSPSIETQDSALSENEDKLATIRGSGTRHSILVVDDNPDLRNYVSEIFRRNGYHVQTARNGSEG